MAVPTVVGVPIDRWDDVVRFRATDGPDRPGVVWGVSASAADQVMRALRNGVTPGGAGLDGPWAAVVVAADGRIVAAASSVLSGGLFWTVDRPPGRAPELVLGVRLAAVVGARRSATGLDHRFVMDFARMRPAADATPYQEVRRIPPGRRVVWDDLCSAPWRSPDGGPETWPAPTVQGPGVAERYLATFDRAVDDLVVDGEALCATLSGGLDSSFVVASLVRHATPDRPVLAFSHAPRGDAGLRAIGNWDPDDSAFAAEMERAHPGLVRVIRVVNEDRRRPLDVAAEAAAGAWAPVFNPANQVWIDDMASRAAALGGTRLFLGTNGNASFSFHHPYAARFYAARGDVRALAGLVRHGMAGGMPVGEAFLRRIAGPLSAPVRYGVLRSGPGYGATVGLSAGPPAPHGSDRRPTVPGRSEFLTWMRAESGLPISLQPSPTGMLLVDPFTSRAVLELAASISPLEWNRGPGSRGYARLLGEGRVPDAIRLRTRRGGQAWDAWFVVHDDRDRYLGEVEELAGTPVLRDIVDARRLREAVQAWPWGVANGPPPLELTAVDRLLSLAAFTRLTVQRLRLLAGGGGGAPAGEAPLRG